MNIQRELHPPPREVRVRLSWFRFGHHTVIQWWSEVKNPFRGGVVFLPNDLSITECILPLKTASYSVAKIVDPGRGEGG